MSRARVAVLKVISKQLSVTAAAAEYGYSRQHLHRLIARYRAGGLDAVEPRSRRPLSNPQATEDKVRDFIVKTRLELTAAGWDAGPVTIAWHLDQAGLHVPSTPAIRRILHAAGLVAPEPRKRPRSSYLRFEAAMPNECWQSDFTHWALAGGTGAEIINWLDDHSRYLLSMTAHERVSGTVVLDTFSHCINAYGVPASTLTDNGMVYTARFVGGKNAFEYLLSALGVDQKNGSPAHPQTQGKIERFHQTLKRWLRAQPACDTLEELQEQLDRFATIYNEQRPHRSLNRRTPGSVYRATPTASPRGDSLSAHYRVRLDIVTKDGKLTLRRAGRLHHLGIGIEHRRVRVIMLVDESQVTVTSLDTGEVLALNNIDPHAGYWRNQLRPPGRWPQL